MTFEDFARAHGLIIKQAIPHRWVAVPTTDHPQKRNGRYKWIGDVGWVQNWATMDKPEMWRGQAPLTIKILAPVQDDRQQLAAQAVKKAGSTDTDKVIAAMAGQTFQAPGGFVSTMDKENHHLHKPVFIGEIKADGQFNVVWKTKGPVVADPWSDYIAENKGKANVPTKK